MKAAFVVALLVAGCTTNRVSDNFTCTTNAECDPDRVCDTGYCVVGKRPVDARVFNDAPVCPAVCGGTCDFGTMSCTITGNGNIISCPAGWNCKILCGSAGDCPSVTCTNAASCDVTCTGAGACGNISCTAADCTRSCTGAGACAAMTCASGDCTQTCSGGTQACGNLTCGTGKCTATCQGLQSSCKDVSCAQSCGCEVNCDSVANTCPANMTCKTTGNGANQKYCSGTGVQGDACTLDGAGGVSGCNTCP